MARFAAAREGRHLVADVVCDEMLLARMQQREEAALVELYQSYRQPIYRLAYRLTGDEAAAEEVLQDVFQAVWLSADSFRPGGDLPAWIIAITHHRAVDTTRSRRFRASRREVALDECELSAGSGASHDPTEALVMHEALVSALAQLPEQQRRVIVRSFFEGLTLLEIAEQSQVPLGTVKSRLRQGLLRLRSLLANSGAQ